MVIAECCACWFGEPPEFAFASIVVVVVGICFFSLLPKSEDEEDDAVDDKMRDDGNLLDISPHLCICS